MKAIRHGGTYLPPQQTSQSNPTDFASLAAMPWEPHDPDWRDASLRIVLDSVTVHRVRRVEFDTEEFTVARRRWEKRDVDF
jgi:hypothetical protein